MKNKIVGIIESLHKKFGENIQLSSLDNVDKLEEIEVKSRACYGMGVLINSDSALSPTQKEVGAIYSEIFTDLNISLYLGCCAIDNSPKILLRRALELGISTVYFWDMPYKYWNWKKHDDHANDLNFREMLDYLNNPGYIDFVNHQNNSVLNEMLNKYSINKIYRELSNVIHGKSENFESTNSDSFTYKKADLVSVLLYILKIENILLSIWKLRFPNYFVKIENDIPAITRYNYEY